MKALSRDLNLIMLVIGVLVILGGSAYAMTQVTQAVPASVTVEVMPGVIAEPILGAFQDPADGAAGVRLGVARVYDSSTGEDVTAPLASFQSRMSYDGSCVNILEVRSSDFTATALDIDNASGLTTFSGGASPPIETLSNLYHAVARLVGSNQVPCVVVVELNSLLDGAGNPVLAPDTSIQNLRRGDARADGVIDVGDALFIAQYLVGSRPACATVVDATCLHSINAASVQHDGGFDQITIADASNIAQYLSGLRDEFYNLITLDHDLGRIIFTGSGGCLACHTIEGDSSGMAGPDLTHIGTDAATRKPGVSARDYITESIRNPEAFVPTGVERAIPGLMTSAITAGLSDNDVEPLVNYLLAQR